MVSDTRISNTRISDEVHRSHLVAILQNAVNPLVFPLSSSIDPYQVVARDPFCVNFPFDAQKFMLSYENRFRDPFHLEGTQAATKPWLHYVYGMVALNNMKVRFPLVDEERGKFIADALALCYLHDFRYAKLSYKDLLVTSKQERNLQLGRVVFKGALEYIGLVDRVDEINSSLSYLVHESVESRGVPSTYNDIHAKGSACKVMLGHLDWLSFALQYCDDRSLSDIGWHAVRLYPLPTTIATVTVEHGGALSTVSMAHTQIYNTISSSKSVGIMRLAARSILGKNVDLLREILRKPYVPM